MSQKKTQQRRPLLATASVLAAAAAAAVSGGTAYAQDGEEIVVTGSRIPQPNLTTTSPVTQLTADDITTQGVTRLEDLVNQLPQAFAAQNATVSNGSTGAATVDLRGLGAARTLVLVNGHRLPYGHPDDAAADINSIPGALVERVEVLTGGSSAVYGSDAISGVVNFIMKDDFEGFRVDAQYGFYQHSNDFDGDGYLRDEIGFRNSTNPAQFRLPDDVIDGYSKEITGIFGVSSEDGRGNVTAYLNYRNNAEILQGNRDFSSCSLGNPSTSARPYAFQGPHWTCGGSYTSYPGYFGAPNGDGALTVGGNGSEFVAWDGTVNQYNFGPLNYYQRPDERYAFGAFAHYQINDRAEVYSELMFSDYQSNSQGAPSGNFFSTNTINCGNPLLSSQQQTAIGCSGADVLADTVVPLYVGRRNVEGGPRQDNMGLTTYRGLIGVRGPLSEGWDYDVSASYASTTLSQVYINDFSTSRLARALDVVDVGGVPTCRSVVDGTDANCVPYNIFQIGGVTQEALNYVQIPLVRTAEMTQQVVTGTITGDLGFAFPTASENISTAFGIEYRRDALESIPDAAFQSGDGAGQGGATTGIVGETDSLDLFAEARIPLVEDAAFARSVSMDLAYRRSDYSTGTESDTYKIGLDWEPIEDIRFRASYQRAVRAPNIIELFSAQGFNLFDMADDPCDLNDPAGDGVAPAANCQGVNPWQVTAGQAAGNLTNGAGQYNFLQGGNPDLEPETADTYTVGFVLQPSFLPGFNLSVDYFNIRIEDTITIVQPASTVAQCFNDGNLDACSIITRNPGNGRLWTGTGVVGGLNTNIGALETSGIDINANYQVSLGDMGALNFNVVGTYLEELVTEEGPGLDTYDCAGYFSGSCGIPNPEWRHRARVGWETPWDVEVSATWRYYDSVVLVTGNAVETPGRLDSEFDAENYFDLAANWQLGENANIRLGVNNILDNDPPVSSVVGTTGNGNTYPQTYDSFGRQIFIGTTLDF